MECRVAEREKNRVYLNCEYCGKEYYIPKHEYETKLQNNQKHFYCCRQCRENAEKHDIEEVRKEFEQRGYELISDVYESAKSYLEYKCKKHSDKGILRIKYSNFASGFGCKYCGSERTGTAKRNDFEKVKLIFLEHNMTLLDNQEYKNAHQKLKYICNNHPEKGVQEMSCANAMNNYCPYCASSKGEKEVVKWLEDNGIEYQSQKKFDDLLGIGNGKLSYDFYVPFYNLLIEYQGRQHYTAVDAFAKHTTPQESFAIQQEHDERKRNYAKINGYELLEIPYTEFENIPNILSNILIQKSSETAGDS